ncbi:hypothetical protein ABZT45_34605, partial [Streptomyces sp. NPDC005356]
GGPDTGGGNGQPDTHGGPDTGGGNGQPDTHGGPDTGGGNGQPDTHGGPDTGGGGAADLRRACENAGRIWVKEAGGSYCGSPEKSPYYNEKTGKIEAPNLPQTPLPKESEVTVCIVGDGCKTMTDHQYEDIKAADDLLCYVKSVLEGSVTQVLMCRLGIPGPGDLPTIVTPKGEGEQTA